MFLLWTTLAFIMEKKIWSLLRGLVHGNVNLSDLFKGLNLIAHIQVYALCTYFHIHLISTQLSCYECYHARRCRRVFFACRVFLIKQCICTISMQLKYMMNKYNNWKTFSWLEEVSNTIKRVWLEQVLPSSVQLLWDLSMQHIGKYVILSSHFHLADFKHSL